MPAIFPVLMALACARMPADAAARSFDGAAAAPAALEGLAGIRAPRQGVDTPDLLAAGTAVERHAAVQMPAVHARLQFQRTPGQRPASLQVADANLTCEAPCIHALPDHQMSAPILQMGAPRSRQEPSPTGADIQLELVRSTSQGKLIAGGVLMGLGATSLTSAIVWAALGLAIYNSDEAFDTVGGMLFGESVRITATSYCIAISLACFALGVATLTPGIVLVQRGKALFDIERPPRQEKARRTTLQSLRFAAAPLRDGAIAGVSFRF